MSSPHSGLALTTGALPRGFFYREALFSFHPRCRLSTLWRTTLLWRSPPLWHKIPAVVEIVPPTSFFPPLKTGPLFPLLEKTLSKGFSPPGEGSKIAGFKPPWGPPQTRYFNKGCPFEPRRISPVTPGPRNFSQGILGPLLPCVPTWEKKRGPSKVFGQNSGNPSQSGGDPRCGLRRGKRSKKAPTKGEPRLKKNP